MNFAETLRRIILRLTGQPCPDPPVQVSTTEPQQDDSKEKLALKWERVIIDKQ